MIYKEKGETRKEVKPELCSITTSRERLNRIESNRIEYSHNNNNSEWVFVGNENGLLGFLRK
jgi:regulator of PEP synthase PpsR (kinase-PPPase family)